MQALSLDRSQWQDSSGMCGLIKCNSYRAGTELWLHPGRGRLTVLLVHQDGGYEADGGELRRAVRAIGLAPAAAFSSSRLSNRL
jgi:hypothetical protein